MDASHALLLKACTAAGLAADGAEPIHLGENALWRLPHRVVVRISRRGQWQAAVRELAVARWLTSCDFPAVRPLDGRPEPLEVDGHPVTFWHQLPPHRPGTPAELALLLRRLHELPVPGLPLGRFDPFVRLADRIAGAGTLDDGQRRWLRRRLTELRAAWSALPAGRPLRVIHGDAWPGNVAVTPAGGYLLDFERTSVGPPEWDLAATAADHSSFGTGSDREYATFCATYGADVTTWAGYPALRDIRELRVTCFALQHATADPARYREQAHHRLACLQGHHGPRPWSWQAIS